MGEPGTPKDPISINQSRPVTRWMQIDTEAGGSTSADVTIANIANGIGLQPDARFNLLRYRVYTVAGNNILSVTDSTSFKKFVDAGSFADRPKVGVCWPPVLQQAIQVPSSTSNVCTIDVSQEAQVQVIFQALVSYWE